jgi:hypothetical protein
VATLLHARTFLPLYSLCWLVGSRIKVKLCCCVDEVVCYVSAPGLPVKPGAQELRGCQSGASDLQFLNSGACASYNSGVCSVEGD